ncbi:MAG TPA: HAD-IB family hydrolase [Gaiellaceae bacterium]|nr:HAD-IB family hydrolase [Gaiellaceae bacterium]
MSGAAAFFDLDRTLLSRSSSLALAGSFRERGLIGRRQLVKAGIAQLLFSRFGAGHDRAGQTADAAMAVLKDLPVATMREIVREAWEPVLRPLVYREALELAEDHQARGEAVLVVSGALQEVADELALGLGLTGALGSRAEVRDGVYTGRLERRLIGPEKAVALEELAAARGHDLQSSTAYSDSATDLAFLEAVGIPVAINPDRELRRIARGRGWPVRRFRRQLGSS